MQIVVTDSVYGRLFMQSPLDVKTEETLDYLRSRHPDWVHQDTDGSWWLGERVAATTSAVVRVDEGREGLWTFDVGGLPGAEDSPDVMPKARREIRDRVQAFCGTLPDHVAFHESLMPLGHWFRRGLA